MNPLNSQNAPELSSAGLARRQQIKDVCGERLAGIRTRQRRLRQATRVSAVAALLAGLLAVRWISGGFPRSAPDVRVVREQPSTSNPAPTFVESPPCAKHSPSGPAVTPEIKIETIDDQRLLQLLAEAGKPSTLGASTGNWSFCPQVFRRIRNGALRP